MLLTLPPILEYLEDTHREEVDRKVEELHNRWMKLKNILENRLDLGAVYVKFHMEADIVGKELDNLETSLQKTPDEITEEDVKKLEEKWESIVPLYQSAKNTGLTFISQANQVRYLLSYSNISESESLMLICFIHGKHYTLQCLSLL